MMDSIQYGSKKIDFAIEYTRRKSIGITVMPDLTVLVKAPEGAALEKVKAVVEKKASWIIKQQQFFLSFQPKMPHRKFVSGETHLYLGRGYKLKVVQHTKNSVSFNAREILVYTKPGSSVRHVLQQWYKERAKQKFAEIADPLIERFEKYHVAPSNIYLQEMPNRWGSCTPKGKIILNPQLIMAPKACIEYVIIHELCHLIHKNHTLHFFQLQAKEMPDWERWKTKLETLLA